MNESTPELNALRDAIQVTSHQAYLAMYEFFRQYYERGRSDEIGGLLGSLSLLPDGSSADPAMDRDWAEAIDTVMKGSYTGANLLLAPPSQ